MEEYLQWTTSSSMQLSGISEPTSASSRLEFFDTSLRSLQEKLNKSAAFESTRFDSLTSTIKSLELEQASEPEILESQASSVRTLETNLSNSITEQKRTYKDAEFRLEKSIDEKLYAIRVDLSKEKKIREEIEENQMGEFNEQIYSLQEAVTKETSDREGLFGGIAEFINNEFAKQYSQLQDSKKTRIKVHSDLNHAVSELKNTIKTEIQNNYVQRRNTEEKIIQVLEDTCRRIELNLLYK